MVESIKNYNITVDGPMSYREQAMLYYDVLNRDGLGATFFCNRSEGFGQYCTRTEEAFEKQYDIYADKSNCYIPLNIFSGEYRLSDDKTKRGWFRTDKDVRFVNGILVDFDIMKNKGKNPSISYSIEEGDKLVDKIIGDMDELVDEEKMVYPTLLTKSGRGLQYIILYKEPISKSDDGAMFKHKRLYKTMTTYLQSLYDKDLVEVDTAVTDAPRICRLPGTKHIKNDRYAELQQYNATCYYSLDELCELFEVDLTPEEKKKTGRPKKENQNGSSKRGKKQKKSTIDIKYYPLGPRELPKLTAIQKNDIKGRIAMMKKLANLRGMVSGDMREVLCFWYYNHQRQIAVPIAAMQMTHILNSRFDEPLDKEELSRCIKGIQTHVGEGDYPNGYYVCSRETLAAHLCMSEEEIKETKFFKRKEERERAATNDVLKKEGKQFLFAMLSDGALDKAEIVKLTMEHTGKSQATIYRWINELENVFSFSHILEKNNKMMKNQGESESLENASEYNEEVLPSGIEYVKLTKEEMIKYYKNFVLTKKSEKTVEVVEDGHTYIDRYIESIVIAGSFSRACIEKEVYIKRYLGDKCVNVLKKPREKIMDIRPLEVLTYNKQGKIDTYAYPDDYVKGHWDFENVCRDGKMKKRWVFNEKIKSAKKTKQPKLGCYSWERYDFCY